MILAPKGDSSKSTTDGGCEQESRPKELALALELQSREERTKETQDLKGPTSANSEIVEVESELTKLPLDERIEYLKFLGVSESGQGNLIRETYDLLGLRTSHQEKGKQKLGQYLQPAGMTTPQAAGVIHSNFEKGLIRAETLRSEGKEYVVQEGDVMLFQFNA